MGFMAQMKRLRLLDSSGKEVLRGVRVYEVSNMPKKYDNRIAQADPNGKDIYVNARNFNPLTLRQKRRVLVHELVHFEADTLGEHGHGRVFQRLLKKRLRGI